MIRYILITAWYIYIKNKYISGAKVEFMNNEFQIPYMNYSVKIKKNQQASKKMKIRKVWNSREENKNYY